MGDSNNNNNNNNNVNSNDSNNDDNSVNINNINNNSYSNNSNNISNKINNDNNNNSESISLCVPDLTEGLLMLSKIPLDAITLKLNELQKEQLLLLNELKNENLKIQNVKNVDVIVENFKKIQEYLVKIQLLKREMANSQDRMNRLNDRAKNLKEKKKQYQIQLNEKVEKALQKERELTVKPSAELQSQQAQQAQHQSKHKQPHTLNQNITL